ncbi:MAG: hypothetical protein JWL60_2603 [Gemmatimonadetes bacterium]|nr:hypothetical protein [Gemmatimonadota bacterium]
MIERAPAGSERAARGRQRFRPTAPASTGAGT